MLVLHISGFSFQSYMVNKGWSDFQYPFVVGIKNPLVFIIEDYNLFLRQAHGVVILNAVQQFGVNLLNLNKQLCCIAGFVN